ncbi:DUF2273 domain-containing protein [Exiguobacterium sp. s192]|uniref:DUF2273 domain-containing protein n=1 Tax=Exiguobacterium sp. s192 TaxID=2751206 RepID=UPI001BE56F4D|nr:DUF2273 domain-containing protein [Exiguobacterium sp. s192]
MSKKEQLYPYRFRLVGSFFGILIAILFLTIGFGATILLFTFALTGFLIGQWRDGALDVKGWIQFFNRD